MKSYQLPATSFQLGGLTLKMRTLGCSWMMAGIWELEFAESREM
jgi:hypothetical protein